MYYGSPDSRRASSPVLSLSQFINRSSIVCARFVTIPFHSLPHQKQFCGVLSAGRACHLPSSPILEKFSSRMNRVQDTQLRSSLQLRILLLAASPEDLGKVDQYQKELHVAIKQLIVNIYGDQKHPLREYARIPEQIKLVDHLICKTTDIVRLLVFKPHILHLYTHMDAGVDNSRIAFLSDNWSNPAEGHLTAEMLNEIIQNHNLQQDEGDRIQCVLLTGCKSVDIATAILPNVGSSIATTDTVGPTQINAYCKQWYHSIFCGDTIVQAHHSAVQHLRFEERNRASSGKLVDKLFSLEGKESELQLMPSPARVLTFTLSKLGRSSSDYYEVARPLGVAPQSLPKSAFLEEFERTTVVKLKMAKLQRSGFDGLFEEKYGQLLASAALLEAESQVMNACAQLNIELLKNVTIRTFQAESVAAVLCCVRLLTERCDNLYYEEDYSNYLKCLQIIKYVCWMVEGAVTFSSLQDETEESESTWTMSDLDILECWHDLLLCTLLRSQGMFLHALFLNDRVLKRVAETDNDEMKTLAFYGRVAILHDLSRKKKTVTTRKGWMKLHDQSRKNENVVRHTGPIDLAVTEALQSVVRGTESLDPVVTEAKQYMMRKMRYTNAWEEGIIQEIQDQGLDGFIDRQILPCMQRVLDLEPQFEDANEDWKSRIRCRLVQWLCRDSMDDPSGSTPEQLERASQRRYEARAEGYVEDLLKFAADKLLVDGVNMPDLETPRNQCHIFLAASNHYYYYHHYQKAYKWASTAKTIAEKHNLRKEHGFATRDMEKIERAFQGIADHRL